MFGLIEAIFSLLTALINACFPCTCGTAKANESPPEPKKRKRYSITETTTTTHTTTIEALGTSTSSPNLQTLQNTIEKQQETNQKSLK